MKITGLLNLTLKVFRANNYKVVRNNSSRANKMVVDLFNKLKNNKSRNLTYILNIRAIKKLIFLIPNTKKAFNHLKQAFIKTLIFQYFGLKYYIQIKINALKYIINKVLSQLNLNSNVSLNNLNKSDFD